MISYRFVPISSQKGVLFLRHPVAVLGECQFSQVFAATTVQLPIESY